MEDNTNQEIDTTPENVERIFNKVEEIARREHEKQVKGAQYTGYVRKALGFSRPLIVGLANYATDNPEARPVVTSGIRFVEKLGNELLEVGKVTDVIIPGLYNLSASAHTLSTTTGTGIIAINRGPIDEEFLLPPDFLVSEPEIYAQRLDKLDPALGNTYRAIWESYTGQKSDPERTALVLMRQVFDHLFDRLAPDKDVRASPYWRPKEGENPNDVHRIERIIYAANTHIPDKARAKTLTANAELLDDTYQLLNYFHKRGELDKKKTHIAILAMRRFLEDWVDAMGL